MSRRRSSKRPTVTGIRRCEPDLSGSVDAFWDRLHETLEWCKVRIDVADPQRCLRSDETRPRVLERDYFAAVFMAAAPRRHVASSAPRPHSVGRGRLLVYFPDDELADGAAEVQSNGFFDVNNPPPWDTWVAMVEDAGRVEHNPYLVSWVPPEFIPRVQRGIDVNPEECIRWLDMSDVALRALIASGTG